MANLSLWVSYSHALNLAAKGAVESGLTLVVAIGTEGVSELPLFFAITAGQGSIDTTIGGCE